MSGKENSIFLGSSKHSGFNLDLTLLVLRAKYFGGDCDNELSVFYFKPAEYFHWA